MSEAGEMAPAAGPTTARRADVARLTADGRTTYEIADELGCSQSTVSNDARALGIVTRKGRRPRHAPAPTDQRCETCGELLEFRFPSDAVGARYCLPECRHEAIAKYPKPEPERTCETCGKTFPPRRAYSHGLYEQRYCSVACSRTGELVACPRCGRERYLAGWAIRRGYRFCSPRCWGKQRWHDGIALAALVDGMTVKARRRWKGRWSGRAAGRRGGRQRGYTAEHVRQVRGLRSLDPKIGRRRIARLVKLSDEQVRAILAELEG